MEKISSQAATAYGLQSFCTLLSCCVLCLSDVETVRSLVEEMNTDSADDTMTDKDPDQQGIGKRVIGELLAPKKRSWESSRVEMNAPVHPLIPQLFYLCHIVGRT